MDAYWRAANYLSVGRNHSQENRLLKTLNYAPKRIAIAPVYIEEKQ